MGLVILESFVVDKNKLSVRNSGRTLCLHYLSYFYDDLFLYRCQRFNRNCVYRGNEHLPKIVNLFVSG